MENKELTKEERFNNLMNELQNFKKEDEFSDWLENLKTYLEKFDIKTVYNLYCRFIELDEYRRALKKHNITYRESLDFRLNEYESLVDLLYHCLGEFSWHLESNGYKHEDREDYMVNDKEPHYRITLDGWQYNYLSDYWKENFDEEEY